MHQRMQVKSNSGPSWPVRMSEAVSAVEMVVQVGNVLAGDEVTAGVDSFSSVGGNLLGAVWKFGDAAHWLTTRNPLTGTFQSMPVGSLSGALNRASELAQSGFDVYLSPSEFEAHAKTRKAQDVAWSSGALRGLASKPWTTAGGNGLTGEQYFGTVWQRFLTETYSGRPTTLRTIYRDAAMTGWVDPADQFELITDASEVAA